MNPADVLIAIPAYNEQSTVAGVVADIKAVMPDARIVVVDDGSTDETAQVAAAAGAVVLGLPFNVGVGGAMRTAFLFAQQQGVRAVVQVDADGQHDPADIPLLLAELDCASVVIGARFAGHGDYQVGGVRRLAMRLLARSLSRYSGQQLTDTTSGFRACDEAAIRLFARHYPAEYLGDTVESLVIAVRAGLTIHQVPVAMRSRQGGKPRTGNVRSALYLARAMLALTIAMGGTHAEGVDVR